jgi:Family of unknown function (DUF6220)
MRIARAALPFLAFGFLGLLAIQVFLAGIGLFGAGTMAGHRDFGYLLSVLPLFVVVAAAVGRGGRLVWLSGALLVLTFVQTLLPLLKADLPYVAALHPVNALVLVVLAATIGRQAMTLARAPLADAQTASAH